MIVYLDVLKLIQYKNLPIIMRFAHIKTQGGVLTKKQKKKQMNRIKQSAGLENFQTFMLG